MIRLSGLCDPNIGTELNARIRTPTAPLLPWSAVVWPMHGAAEGVPSNAGRVPEQPAIFSDRARGRFFSRSRRCLAPCSYFGVCKGALSGAANSRSRGPQSGGGLLEHGEMLSGRCGPQGLCLVCWMMEVDRRFRRFSAVSRLWPGCCGPLRMTSAPHRRGVLRRLPHEMQASLRRFPADSCTTSGCRERQRGNDCLR